MDGLQDVLYGCAGIIRVSIYNFCQWLLASPLERGWSFFLGVLR